MTDGLSAAEKRVLNPRPYRHYRRTYSVREVWAGVAVLGLLALFGGWVAWRGAHPDPELFADPLTLLPNGTAGDVVDASSSPKGATSGAEKLAGSPAAPAAPVSPSRADRGALPAGLAAPGWTEAAPSRFGAANLYEKINGRADYFLSRGFTSLTFVTLSSAASKGTLVDVELYDLSSPENALSAFSGERPPEVKAATASGTSSYVARNALFLSRGPFYVRAIGSDESPAVLAALEHLRATLAAGLAPGAGAERPWAQALFQDALAVPADRVTYQAENAFSFGFAKNVHVATLADGETELFVAAAPSPAEAAALASRFAKGFAGYGETVSLGGESWVKDRYLGGLSRAAAVGTFVVGVRGAPKADEATKALAALRKGVSALPAGVVARAVAAASKKGAKGESHE